MGTISLVEKGILVLAGSYTLDASILHYLLMLGTRAFGGERVSEMTLMHMALPSLNLSSSESISTNADSFHIKFHDFQQRKCLGPAPPT